MEIIKFNSYSFSYAGSAKKALDSVNVTINRGEFVTIFGESGCGKSTLLRQIKPKIAPEGKVCGELFFNGKNISMLTDVEQVTKIAYVFQNPQNGIVTDKVWHELAFELENLGMKNSEITIKVAEVASYFGIDNWFNKNVNELSGGQLQLLNLASAMIMQPEVLVLDEPTAQLDPLAAQHFISTLSKINKELGITVIIAEHRLENILGVSDKIIAMEEGRIIDISSPESLSETILQSDLWYCLPTPIKVASSVDYTDVFPVDVRQGREWLNEYKNSNDTNEIKLEDTERFSKSIISAQNLWFTYNKVNSVIKGCNLDIRENEIYAILGGNGTGKSTLLSLICGINMPLRGKIKVNKDKRISMLPQNPQCLFVKNTVLEELCDVADMNSAEKIAELCGLLHLLDRHPYDLSGGEQQKTALAKVLLINPDILLLDEPTKGFDAKFKEDFAKIITSLKKEGKTIIIVSHDVEFCAEYADRCALLFDGKIVTENNSKSFFNGNSYYTTTANRMSRGIIDNAITCKDLIYACNGKQRITSADKNGPKTNNDIHYKDEKTDTDKNTPCSVKLICFTVFVVMVLTVVLGMYYIQERNFYLVSCLLMLEAFVPFMLMFEKRKPKARELVMISVLCALAVAGRATFYMLPQFKPMIAIVIVTGVCFGAETGFLVGAISAFVSNFFMGQGPWTPWQMFALGAIGFVAGVLFNIKIIKKNKMSLTVYGILASIVIYGFIMNTATVIMTANTINAKLLSAALISGFPFDVIHAFATAVFLWFAAEPLITKLERIKKKYKIIK